jgi:hypothetical protein
MFLRPFGLYCSACFGSLCASSVHVVATFSGTILFPLPGIQHDVTLDVDFQWTQLQYLGIGHNNF